MKIAALIARILLGLEFVVFGMNKFLHFIPVQVPPGLAGQFEMVLFGSHYWVVIALLEIIGGILLLAGRYVPLALTLLGPIVVNILMFHGMLEPKGLPIALLTAILWFVIFFDVKSAFAGIFAQRVNS